MSISIYKPNSKNTGCAFSFRYGIQKNSEPCVYVNAIKQHSWDDSSKTGSFSESKSDPSKVLSIKFNEFECGSIVNCIKNRYEYNTFHTHESNKTTIKFSPWDKSISISSLNPSTKKFESKKQTVPAFGISITRNGSDTFKIPVDPGEVEVLFTFFNNIINRVVDFRIDKQLENYKNS